MVPKIMTRPVCLSSMTAWATMVRSSQRASVKRPDDTRIQRPRDIVRASIFLKDGDDMPPSRSISKESGRASEASLPGSIPPSKTRPTKAQQKARKDVIDIVLKGPGDAGNLLPANRYVIEKVVSFFQNKTGALPILEENYETKEPAKFEVNDRGYFFLVVGLDRTAFSSR